MKTKNNGKPRLVLRKRGTWGGYTIERIGSNSLGYFWIGRGDQYLMSITFAEAKHVAKFIK